MYAVRNKVLLQLVKSVVISQYRNISYRFLGNRNGFGIFLFDLFFRHTATTCPDAYKTPCGTTTIFFNIVKCFALTHFNFYYVFAVNVLCSEFNKSLRIRQDLRCYNIGNAFLRIVNVIYADHRSVIIYTDINYAVETVQKRNDSLCAARNDLNIVHEYIDRAMTGTNDNRKDFQQMLSDSEHTKEWEICLVYALDRFGRNSIEQAINKYKLQKTGKIVISATQKNIEKYRRLTKS